MELAPPILISTFFPGRGSPRLMEGFADDGGVICGGVGSDVAGLQKMGEHIPGLVGTVVGEGQQGVKPEAFLERRRGLFLLCER